jgi:opacity protein-like surface antigen
MLNKNTFRVLIAAFAALGLMTSSMAQSQHKKDQSIKYIFKLGGGISTPIEKEGVYNRDAGYNLNIGAGYAFTPIIGARFDLDYDLFRDPSGKGESNTQTPQFYMLSLKFGVMAGYFLKKKSIKMRPYAILGAGFHYLTDLDSANVTLMPSENDFSIYFGAGLAYMFTPQGGLFLESEYQAFLSGDRLKGNIPVRIGIMFCPVK